MSAFQLFSFCPGNFSFCLGNFCFLLSQFLLFGCLPRRQAGRTAILWSTHFCFQLFSLSAFQLLLVECNALTRELVSFEQALDRRQSKMLKGEK